MKVNDLFTQHEDIDIDLRVSELPHAVVKQAEKFRVRFLQADLQQNNAYNPVSEESSVMVREKGNVKLFEVCETIPKVVQNAFLIGIKNWSVACVGIS